MAQEKYVTAYQALMAAGTTQNLVMITQDENVPRRVTGIFVTPVAVNVAVNLVLRSQPLEQLAGSMFNTTHGLVKLDVVYPQGQQIQVQIVNNTAGNIGPLDVIIRYQVDT